MVYITKSILDSIKKMLGISDDDICFDLDIIIAINSAFSILTGLGVGPEEGYQIEDRTSIWSDFLPEEQVEQLNMIKTYIYLKARMLFDPPSTSFVIEAMNKQIAEYEWRLNVNAEKEGELCEQSRLSKFNR